MRNFDLNRLPEDDEDHVPPAEENDKGFQQNLNIDIDLNELFSSLIYCYKYCICVFNYMYARQRKVFLLLLK